MPKPVLGKQRENALPLSSEGICLQCGRPGFNPWVGKITGEGNGNPLQYSCLEHPTDVEAWSTTVHGVAKSRT